MSLVCKKVSVQSEDARLLIGELNEALTAIIGYNGTGHVDYSDFDRDRSVFMIGYDNGVPACCAGIRNVDETTGEVKRVYARRNRSGNAAALMKSLENWASEQGYTRLILECRQKDKHAIEFYDRTGYAVCEPYGPYVHIDDAVCMDKHIG